jgi:23S rRNA-/tRNA-specific pseudouridylate synthase
MKGRFVMEASLPRKPLCFPDGTPKGPGAIPALADWPPLQDNPGAICYEDDYFLVLNKPAGMLVHPTAREDGYTLWNYVRRYYDFRGLSSASTPFRAWTALRRAS